MHCYLQFAILGFAVGEVLLVSTDSLHSAILQIKKTTVVEGEKVEFKCVIAAVHGEKPENKENWFHLYKNKEKISSLQEPGGRAAVTFIKQDITKNDSGNYTCMYGNKNPGDVKNISHGSSVYLNVQDSLHSAILQIKKTKVVEGEKVEFKCIIAAVHGEKPENKENWFHLYKNKEKISSLPEPESMAAATFIKQDIRKNDTGSYTCMYGNENPGDLKNISHGSSVYLNVQELRYYLTLHLDKEITMEGMDVSFKCMIPAELREATRKEGFFHLYKNGSLVDSQAVPKDLPGVTFSIKKVKRSDTGNYTCVYGKVTLVNSTNSKRSRPVYLHVIEYTTMPTLSDKTQRNSSTDFQLPQSEKGEESYGLGNDIRIFLSLGILLVLSAIVGEDFSSRQMKHRGDDTVQDTDG